MGIFVFTLRSFAGLGIHSGLSAEREPGACLVLVEQSHGVWFYLLARYMQIFRQGLIREFCALIILDQGGKVRIREEVVLSTIKAHVISGWD